MLVYDGIVFKLQRTGGISVLFTELLTRLRPSAYQLLCYGELSSELAATRHQFRPPRILERVRRVRVDATCDLFHSTYYRLPVGPACKVVTTVYDYGPERFASPLRRVAHAHQKSAAVAASDRIICISESTRRDLLDFSGAALADRAVVVYPGVSEEFAPIRGVTLIPQVLFVGTRVAYKNFTAVVDALAGVPAVALVCVGGGPFTNAEVHVLNQRIPGRYKWAGFLPRAELNLEYNRSICLAYPSLHEGFGIPILEAMRAGCPVIAVNTSSIPEVAGDAGVLLERGDADDIRAAILRLMSASVRDGLTGRGFAQAAKFSWDATFHRTVAVYEELLGRRVT